MCEERRKSRLGVVGRRIGSSEQLVEELVVVAFDDEGAEDGHAVEMGGLDPVGRVG